MTWETIWSTAVRIQGVLDFYGLTDFTYKSDGPDDLDQVVRQFLGGRSLEEEASACLHVDADTPPFLIFHGDRDELSNICQSETMYRNLVKQGISADFYILEGCGHGADEFYQEEILEIVADFIHEREKK